MQFTFSEIIAQLNGSRNLAVTNFAYEIVRAKVIPSDYFLATILPEEEHPDYVTGQGHITIYPTMINQAAMDSPFTPLGVMTSEMFQENTIKLGGEMFFTEKDMRDLQALEKSIITTGFARGLSNSQINGGLVVNPQTGLADGKTVNGLRLNALIGMTLAMAKAHFDRREWMRSKALFYNALDWEFNGLPAKVKYKIPTGNFLTPRSSSDAYNASSSKFWTDIRTLYTKLNNFILVMNQNTYNAIIGQSANNISITADSGMVKTIVQWNSQAVRQPNDFRNTQTIYVYNKSGTHFDPTTKIMSAVPFVPDGLILAVGEAVFEGIQLTQGSVDDPTLKYRAGYTHIAPTVESGSQMGTWAKIYTPEAKPMQVLGETAGNTLPMITNGKRICVLETTIS